MNIWENLQIYKHKAQNKLIPEQIQINTKHDTIDVYKRQAIFKFTSSPSHSPKKKQHTILFEDSNCNRETFVFSFFNSTVLDFKKIFLLEFEHIHYTCLSCFDNL